jgi:acetolactate decarboxylase
MNLRAIGLATLSVLLGGCGGASREPGVDASSPPDAGVRIWGALHAVMMENDTAAVVSLATLTPDSTLYAVGAASGLAGEVTVVGGDVWLATPGEGDAVTYTTSRTSGARAALLIAARVPAWREVPIEEAIPFDSLDARIAALAAAAGVDVGAPFPFVIEGPLSRLEWHVVDGRRLVPGAKGHAAHLAASVRSSLDHAPAALIGFYSSAHEGVITHFGAFTHVHAVIPAAQASGHVDHVVVEPGATLRIPAP